MILASSQKRLKRILRIRKITNKGKTGIHKFHQNNPIDTAQSLSKETEKSILCGKIKLDSFSQDIFFFAEQKKQKSDSEL